MEHPYDYRWNVCDFSFTPPDEAESLRKSTRDVQKQAKYRIIPVVKSVNGLKTGFDFPMKVSDLISSLTDETKCLSNSNVDVHKLNKYGTIPVDKSFDGLRTPSTYRENVSGEKETKCTNTKEDNNFNSRLNAVLNRVQARSNKIRSRIESKLPINTIQQKTNYNNPFLQKNRQVSVSEPLLVSAKDRGDSIALQDAYGEDYFPKDAYEAERQSPSMNQEIKGCIYIKSSGKMYKSFIRAENIPTQMDNIFSNPSKISIPLRNSKIKVKERSVFSTNEFKSENDEYGDFEVAIFLSGIKNIFDGKSNGETIVTGCKKNDSADKTNGKMKKKQNFRKKDSKPTLIQRKKTGTSRKVYPSSIKMLKINDQENEKLLSRKLHTNRNPRSETRAPKKTYKVSDFRFDFSSESDTEYVFELAERIPKDWRPIKQKSVSKSNIANEAVKQRENITRNPRLCNSVLENDHTMNFPRQTPQSSLNNVGYDEVIPKIKISDNKLQEKFENIFKRYATTTRHSGEVIPRKISTEWMVNAGVVDGILSEVEADNAFRQAAGTKITMNSIEYKEFLIMLTLRKKLPYYEIYRQMCDVEC